MGTYLGPLTTAWEPAASCSQIGMAMQVTGQKTYFRQGAVVGENPDCFPSGYAGKRDQYYAPAVSCPAGFTAGCSRLNQGAVTETVLICCPTAFRYSCVQDALLEWQSTLGCTHDFSSAWTSMLSVTINDTITTSSYISAEQGGVGAFSLQLRVPASPTTTNPVTEPPVSQGAGTTGSNRGGTSSTPSATGLSEPSSSSVATDGAGISAATAAGIGVGAAAGLIAIAIAIFVLIQRRRRKSGPGAPASSAASTAVSGAYYRYPPHVYGQPSTGKSHEMAMVHHQHRQQHPFPPTRGGPVSELDSSTSPGFHRPMYGQQRIPMPYKQQMFSPGGHTPTSPNGPSVQYQSPVERANFI